MIMRITSIVKWGLGK